MKNRKGFMLAELLISSTVVITAMIFLFTSYSRIYIKYKTHDKYYNVNGVYAAEAIFKELLSSNFNKFVIERLSTDVRPSVDIKSSLNNSVLLKANETKSVEYRYIIENGSCKSGLNILNCDEVKNLYNVENMILLSYDTTTFDIIRKASVVSVDMEEYIDYVFGHYDISNQNMNESDDEFLFNAYSYAFLVEVNDNGKYGYSLLRVR